jgi:hypothetical protein
LLCLALLWELAASCLQPVPMPWLPCHLPCPPPPSLVITPRSDGDTLVALHSPAHWQFHLCRVLIDGCAAVCTTPTSVRTAVPPWTPSCTPTGTTGRRSTTADPYPTPSWCHYTVSASPSPSPVAAGSPCESSFLFCGSNSLAVSQLVPRAFL